MMFVWIIIGILAAALVLVMHETSHAIVAEEFGAKITSFKPWPHKDEDGTFWFGRVTYELKGKLPRDVHSAPVKMSGALFILGIPLSIFVFSPLCLISFFAVVDLLWWFRGYFGLWSYKPTELDGWKWRYYVEE